MNQILVIAKKEFGSFFDSLIAYFLLVLFLGFSGFYTWIYESNVFFMKQASLQVFFQIAYWTLFFFTPALTMRMLAEEKKTGTIEMLLTKAVTDWQVILGKFLACVTLIAVALAFTFPYYFSVWKLGNVDHGSVWCGYLGLLLMSAAYISIGIFASSVTNNQIVAFLAALSIGIFFHFIFRALAGNTGGIMGELFSYLSLSTHYDSISRGVIDSKDVVYFLSVVTCGLVLSELVLAKRNMTD